MTPHQLHQAFIDLIDADLPPHPNAPKPEAAFNLYCSEWGVAHGIGQLNDEPPPLRASTPGLGLSTGRAVTTKAGGGGAVYRWLVGVWIREHTKAELFDHMSHRLFGERWNGKLNESPPTYGERWAIRTAIKTDLSASVRMHVVPTDAAHLAKALCRPQEWVRAEAAKIESNLDHSEIVRLISGIPHPQPGFK